MGTPIGTHLLRANSGVGKVPYLKMLASDRRGVESESAPGFGTVTFCN